MVICGVPTCRALILRRPDDVEHAFCTPEAREALADLLEDAPFGVEESGPDRLARIAGSVHHEGAVLHATAPPVLEPGELAARIGSTSFVVALDRVQNPHNLGAVLRTAAYLEADGVLWSDDPDRPALGTAALRVARGGAEHVALSRVPELTPGLRALKEAGAVAVGADPSAPSSVFRTPLPLPSILVLGHEREGLSAASRRRCDALVSIPGSSSVDSLNLSVAAGILMAEVARSRPGSPTDDAG